MSRMTPQMWSLECWGGATYDVALRFVSEDPWERFARLRAAVPNICLQMLLRGRNTVGYTPYPTEVTDAFVVEAAATDIDVFRIFDALNDVDQMRPAIDAVWNTGTAVAEVALCYTGNLTDPGERLYTLDYYLALAERIVAAGAHVLAIKDMAGLLRAPAADAGPCAARTLRAARPLTYARHARRSARDAARCDRRRRRRRRRRVRRDGGHDKPTCPLLPRRGDRSHGTGHRSVSGGGLRAGAVLGGGAPRLCAVRVGAALADRAGLPPRDPGRRTFEPAAAGHRTRPGLEVRAGRGHVRRRQRHPRQHRQGHAFVKVVGDLALHLVATGADPAAFAAEPDRFDVPDSVIGFSQANSATRPEDGPSRSAPRHWPDARSNHRPPSCPSPIGRGSRPTGGRRSITCSSPGRPPAPRGRGVRTGRARGCRPSPLSSGLGRGG